MFVVKHREYRQWAGEGRYGERIPGLGKIWWLHEPVYYATREEAERVQQMSHSDQRGDPGHYGEVIGLSDEEAIEALMEMVE